MVVDTITSTDVLKIEHRSSEPFDHAVNPADLLTIAFNAGQVAAIDANGYAVRATAANIAVIKLVGLFMTHADPSTLKNDYLYASGNASIFSNGIVTLNTQLTDATIDAGDDLFIGVDGQITNVQVDLVVATGDATTDVTLVNTSAKIGTAMTSRTVADADVRIKLEL